MSRPTSEKQPIPVNKVHDLERLLVVQAQNLSYLMKLKPCGISSARPSILGRKGSRMKRSKDSSTSLRTGEAVWVQNIQGETTGSKMEKEKVDQGKALPPDPRRRTVLPAHPPRVVYIP